MNPCDIPRLGPCLGHPVLPLVLGWIAPLHHLRVLPMIGKPARRLPVEHSGNVAALIDEEIPRGQVAMRKDRHAGAGEQAEDILAVFVRESVVGNVARVDAIPEHIVVELGRGNIGVVAKQGVAGRGAVDGAVTARARSADRGMLPRMVATKSQMSCQTRSFVSSSSSAHTDLSILPGMKSICNWPE